MKKDLLILTEFYYPDIASTGKLLTQLAEDLASLGLSVDVLTGMPSYHQKQKSRNDIEKKSVYNDVYIERIPSLKLDKKNKIGRLLNYFSFTLSVLLRFYKLKNYKNVLVVSNPPLLPIAGYVSSKLYKNNFCYLIHDLYPDIAISLKVIKPNSIMAKTMDFLNDKFFRYAKRVIVLGEDMKQYLKDNKDVDEFKIEVIPNWADKNVIKVYPKQNHYSEKYGLDNKFVVLYSGNIGLFQNLEMIIETAKLLEGYKDIVFLFVGEGGKKEKLINMVKEYNLQNVKFWSYQSEQDYPYLLSSADCHIVTLEEEAEGLGVPSKTYSYLASGRPIIAIMSNKTDVGLLVEQQQIGFRVDQNNINHLRESILALYSSEKLKFEMGKKARIIFEKNYERKICTQKYFYLFNKL
ncbi:glycosyltransferase involved in cell wall biosynthesis [Anoxybacillus vitaminiphilus]|uniref:Glycosyltransferase involved in cell wall biosynthesis n=1 Tax=Paranoxybacillus vitaminiphilus TaxID=581036 RepID=A0A327YHC5_9BACL|nr:glycosyltransferase family 4 protein [Anoxybacillus vitaminiphilus]RAK20390.1 glycosyltransferase involved in cell wall biosynthesis [Anoxybacillus vitaminiphilus]